MNEMKLQLQHLNLPARDPQAMARWYADTLGLQAEDNKVRGPGVLLAFQSGEPIDRASGLHAGYLVPSLTALSQWAERLGGTISKGPEFSAFQIVDPEGNCVELYCKNE
jgi:catechol-2,3-dioxygenase